MRYTHTILDSLSWYANINKINKIPALQTKKIQLLFSFIYWLLVVIILLGLFYFTMTSRTKAVDKQKFDRARALSRINKQKATANNTSAGLQKVIKKKNKLKNNYKLSGDRKIIYDLSQKNKYKNNISLLIIHANRKNKTNKVCFNTLGLSKPRCAAFVRRWFNCTTAENLDTTGIGYFDNTQHNNSGRKRLLSADQMWELFLLYYKTMQTMDTGIYTFAKIIKKKYNYLSENTIVRYIKIFTKKYKKLKQPKELPARTKQQRLAHCLFWDNLGINYLKRDMASIDETTVYTNDIPCILTGYKPRPDIKTYEEFITIAKNNKFRENNNNNIDTPDVLDNPTHDIHNWTMPPIPFERVSNIYYIYLFIYLFIYYIYYIPNDVP